MHFQHHRGQIKITKHAMDRLKERVKSFIGYRSWEHLVKTARYEGRNDETMSDEEYTWCSTHINHLSLPPAMACISTMSRAVNSSMPMRMASYSLSPPWKRPKNG